MAPEMLIGDNFDEKADVYSMGITLFEILFQRAAWGTLSVPGINRKVLRSQRPTIEKVLPEEEETQIEVSERLTKILESSWAQEPEKRMIMITMVAELDASILEYAISKPSGRKFWQQEFDRSTKADWQKFWGAVKKCFPFPNNRKPNQYEEAIRNIIDPKRRGNVTIEVFGKFLEWFGPLDSELYDRVFLLLTHPSFVDMNKHDAQMALKTRMNSDNQQPGYYCTRLSSEPGFFAISLVKQAGIAHHRIRYDSDTKQFFYNKVPYDSFAQVISENSSTLSHPLEGYDDKKYGFLKTDTPDKRPHSAVNYYENPEFDATALRNMSSNSLKNTSSNTLKNTSSNVLKTSPNNSKKG